MQAPAKRGAIINKLKEFIAVAHLVLHMFYSTSESVLVMTYLGFVMYILKCC